MVFGSTEDAVGNLELMSKAQVVMQSLKGGAAGDQVFDMAKALEIKGVSMDPHHFDAMVDAMVKASVASGGRIAGADYLATDKYGRSATQGWDDRFMGLILPTLMQEMKGGGGGGGSGSPGTALQSVFQAVVGGTMSNKAAEEFLNLHLLDPRKVIFTRTGNIKGIRPGGVSGSKEFQDNPYQWVQDVLMPALKAKGITSPDAMREEISHMFVNRTAQQIMIMFATQQQRFEKDAKLISGAKGINAYDDLIKNDPNAQMKAFTEAWDNLMTALGAPLVKTAYGMLMNITNTINSITAVAVAHPEAVKIIGEIGAAVGAFLVVAGSVAVGAAAISALGVLAGPVGLVAVAAGLTAMATALGGFKWIADLWNANPMGLNKVTPYDIWKRLLNGPADIQPGYHKQSYIAPADGQLSIQHASYIPPNNDGRPIQFISYTMLDGRVLAKTVSEEVARDMSLPPAGATRFDGRMTAVYPANTMRV